VYEPPSAFPAALVGGAGAQPQRYYVVSSRDPRAGGGALLARSDDDGRAWQEFTTWVGLKGAAPSGGPNTRAGGLAYDPGRPDLVYVGLNQAPLGASATPSAGQVAVSTDGGGNWAPLGRPELPIVNALALGIDGRNLYAATEQGVWRLSLVP